MKTEKTIAGVRFEINKVLPSGYIWEAYIHTRKIKRKFVGTFPGLIASIMWSRVLFEMLFREEIRRTRAIDALVRVGQKYGMYEEDLSGDIVIRRRPDLQ